MNGLWRIASGGGPIARRSRRASFRPPYGAVLEFKFVSRKIAAKQTMASWRWGQRQAHVRLGIRRLE